MICQAPGCVEHYACSLRSKGVQVSPAATPSRTRQLKKPTDPPSWEAGIVTDKRPDGSQMPLLTSGGDVMRVKEYGENRRSIDAQVKALKTPATT